MSDETKLWTFGQMYEKVREDVDLDEEDPDEQFISRKEMIGFFNEALNEATAEILKLNEDYFLTCDFMPLVQGQSEYELPHNIYAHKLRGVIYENGPLIYQIKKFRMYHKFGNIAFASQYNDNDDYRYYLRNDGPRQVKMVLVPEARETAVLPPLGNFTPVRRWYIRNSNRIPYPGDYVLPQDLLPTSVNTASNTLTVSPLVPYVTGDKVKFEARGEGNLPEPLVDGVVYYVIRVSDNELQLATSLADAKAGAAIDLTTQGTGYMVMRVAASDKIIDATIIDIPEFSTFIMEWVKANCLYKDGDPRLPGTVAKLEQQRTQMVNTLTEREPDQDDTVAGDFSFYRDMS